MNANNHFSYLNHSKKYKNFETEIILHGQKVIPSDTFWLEENEFVILDLPKKNNQIFIKILGINGVALSHIYYIPKQEFEDINMTNISLYKHF